MPIWFCNGKNKFFYKVGFSHKKTRTGKNTLLYRRELSIVQHHNLKENMDFPIGAFLRKKLARATLGQLKEMPF